MKDRILVIYKKDTVTLYKLAQIVKNYVEINFLDPEFTIVITDDTVTEQFIRENLFYTLVIVNSEYDIELNDIDTLRKLRVWEEKR